MYSSISYLTRKSNFKQLNASIPITQEIPNQVSDDDFKGTSFSSLPPPSLHSNPTNQSPTESTKELVADFLRKSKQLEYLIASLPTTPATGGEEDDEADLQELQKEMEEGNRQYLESLGVVEELHERLEGSLREALEGRAGMGSGGV
ncbi:mediator of RNA polymerase II transcription subunit 21, partial [Phenoliferia sp. Uapishka_3]